VQTHKPDSYAIGTANSVSIDAADYRYATVMLAAGTAVATSTVDCKVQDSADASSWADVSGAAFTQVTDTTDEAVTAGVVRLDHVRRYIRVVVTVANAACELGVLVALACPDDENRQTLVYDFEV
jgi:hypothetical protein